VQESQREVGRSLYLQREVQRLASVCHENRQQHAQQHEQIIAQQLRNETLEARLEAATGSRSAALELILEREQSEKKMLGEQLSASLKGYSHVCVKHQLSVAFVEEAHAFLAHLCTQLHACRLNVACIHHSIEEAGAVCLVPPDTTSHQLAAVLAQLAQKQLELDFALDKQLEYQTALSQQVLNTSPIPPAAPQQAILAQAPSERSMRKEAEVQGQIAELQRQLHQCQAHISEHEGVLDEAQAALEHAQEQRMEHADELALLHHQLQERSVQLQLAEESVWKSCESADEARLHVEALQVALHTCTLHNDQLQSAAATNGLTSGRMVTTLGDDISIGDDMSLAHAQAIKRSEAPHLIQHALDQLIEDALRRIDAIIWVLQVAQDKMVHAQVDWEHGLSAPTLCLEPLVSDKMLDTLHTLHTLDRLHTLASTPGALGGLSKSQAVGMSQDDTLFRTPLLCLAVYCLSLQRLPCRLLLCVYTHAHICIYKYTYI